MALLKKDLADSRVTLTQVREDAALIENRLQNELKSLHSKWQQAETRNKELGDQVSSSTRPLLRQISALQSLLEEQRGIWEASEASLTQRAVRAETNSVRAAEQQSAAVADAQAVRLELARCKEKLGMSELSEKAAREEIATLKTEMKALHSEKVAALQEARNALKNTEARWQSETKTANARHSEKVGTRQKCSIKKYRRSHLL